MQVAIKETTTTLPSHPTFLHHHVLPLSHLDTDPAIQLTFRYFRVYSNQNQPQSQSQSRPQPNPFHVITTALGMALVPYYPLTGTLIRSTDGRLELHCTPGRGVQVIRASVDRSLESLNHLDNPDESLSESFVPDPNPDESMAHPLILQITEFSCGGYVLGSAVHNALCDGLGATQFFNAMAKLAHGVTQLTVEPVRERASLLGPRDPPRVEFPFHEIFSLEKDSSSDTVPVEPVVRECFYIKEEWMDRFKSYLLEKSGSHFTTFEALGAFVWRAKVKAAKIPKNKKVHFGYLMNIRKTVQPPLPKGYWGNGCAQMFVQLTAGELVEQPLWLTSELIKKSKHNATDEYVRSYIDFHWMNRRKVIGAPEEVSGFTDWRHIGHASVDFGSGGPVGVFPLAKRFLLSEEPCFFLPVGEGKKGEEFKMLVNLREAAMDRLMVEMEKFSRQKFDLC